jgi:transcriptional regulator with XRE-family HTH domain
MSPRKLALPSPKTVIDADRRLWFGVGRQIRDARLSRKLSVRDLAMRAELSADVVYLIEAGQTVSTEALVRVADALNLRLEFALTDPRKKEQRPNLSGDVVHSAMGEFEAAHFRALGFRAGLDEPFQHYQFAGRADFVAWDADARALLHIENRTRFPDFQEMAGSFNNKRAYFADAFAERVGVRGWTSQTHVIAALWSSEVLHALRLRTESFRSLCPDHAQLFDGWWSTGSVAPGRTSVLVVLDPHATRRQRAWIGLEDALLVRPRYRGYAEAAAAASATTAASAAN